MEQAGDIIDTTRKMAERHKSLIPGLYPGYHDGHGMERLEKANFNSGVCIHGLDFYIWDWTLERILSSRSHHQGSEESILGCLFVYLFTSYTVDISPLFICSRLVRCFPKFGKW